MREEKMPELDTDEELDAWYEDKAYIDYKPWEVLESVDALLDPFGLEVVYWENGDSYFNIQKRL